MKKLTKYDLESRDEISDSYFKTVGELSEMITNINSLIEAANAKAVEVNDALDDMRTFAEETAERINDYVSEKSEEWQESEVGRRFSTWHGEWERFSADDVDTFESLEEVDTSAATDLKDLPVNPDEF